MSQRKRAPAANPRWLLLVHQLPAHPGYLRVKIWRHLQALGAVAVKKSVYALPLSDEALEDLLWTAKQIEAGGGEALVCESRLLHGRTDEELRALFDAARAADYERLLAEARRALRRIGRHRKPGGLGPAAAGARRLRKRFGELAQIDFFGAHGREAADSAVREVEAHLAALSAPASRPPAKADGMARRLRSRVWVTRRGVKIDRVACAWLIRRFIDPKASFRFVEPTTYAHAPGELRFDMADAEFTHRGDRCSFEVLLQEAALREPALQAIGEIVHDLDLKDAKFGRAEAEGVRLFVEGLVLATDDDATRVRQAGALLDHLYRSLQQRPRRRSAGA